MIICSLYISACGHRIFKILLSTPHYYGGIIGGKHQNFEDPITWSRDISKTKFDLLGVFLDHPLDVHQNVLKYICLKGGPLPINDYHWQTFTSN